MRLWADPCQRLTGKSRAHWSCALSRPHARPTTVFVLDRTWTCERLELPHKLSHDVGLLPFPHLLTQHLHTDSRRGGARDQRLTNNKLAGNCRCLSFALLFFCFFALIHRLLTTLLKGHFMELYSKSFRDAECRQFLTTIFLQIYVSDITMSQAGCEVCWVTKKVIITKILIIS